MRAKKQSSHILMSTLGRSHFIVAADALIRQGVGLDLLQGWVPHNLKSWTVKVCAWIEKRKSFVVGLSKRSTPALLGHIITEPLPELLQTVWFLSFGKIGEKCRHFGVRLAFKLHGKMTCKHLKDYSIFHVKSGLGQGGAIKKAKQLGLKVVVDHCTLHPYFMGKSGGRVGYREAWSFWELVLKDCAEADLLIVGSEFIKETFMAQGFEVDKIRVIPLGILNQFFGVKTQYAKTGPLQLIYTGSWGYQKGCPFLVDALEHLVKNGIACNLTVVGGYRQTDESYCRAIKQQLPIHFIGHVPQDDLRHFLSKADIYIFPSLSDGFGVSAIEAMGAGLCMVTTRESSICIEEGKTGYYIPAKSGVAIADRIAYLDQHRDEIEYLGRAAAEMVRTTYTWEKYAIGVEKVYQELLADNSKKI